jgi:GH43 family beta-xylosidase
MKKIRNFTAELSSRDPDIIFHGGLYYGCFASEGDSISIICAPDIDGLATAEPKKVYIAEPGTPWSKQLWAPELHVLDGNCYIYVACDDGNNHNHRMYVLENGSSDPLAPYTMHGKISDDTDRWAIDGTVLSFGGKRYFVWSGWEGELNVCQNLYIAEMSDPFTISSKRVLLSTPEYEWEKLGADGSPESPFINEGPYAFTLDGQTYISYSGAGSWCKDYCIALLKLVGEDPLDPTAWEKEDTPLFSANEEVFGAGHCSVIVREDGKSADLFFHGWDCAESVVEWNTVGFWHSVLSSENGKLVLL